MKDFTLLNPNLALTTEGQTIGVSSMEFFNSDGSEASYVEPSTDVMVEQMTAILKIMKGTELRHTLVLFRNLVGMIEHSAVQGAQAVVSIVKNHPKLTEDQKDAALQAVESYFSEDEPEDAVDQMLNDIFASANKKLH
jgi:hypothetical protein